jgi:RNA polymerase sigma factor (sigma-70 family)
VRSLKLGRDPFAHPELLVERVYAYVAYRLGGVADVDDVTSEVFEQALRYRSSYDSRKGEPVAWLIGIARRCVAQAFAAKSQTGGELPDIEAPGNLEEDTIERIELDAAMSRLSDRDHDLIALRYGADLPARQIAEVLEMSRGAVEVGLHRALDRLRRELERTEDADTSGGFVEARRRL